MKRRLGSYTKRKPIVQLDDVPKENFGLGFKKETENADSFQESSESNDGHLDPSTIQGSDDPLNAIKFVKSTSQPEVISEDLDSKLSDFLKEISELDVKEASILKKGKSKDLDTANIPREPVAPTCAWQAVLDETSQCCYYWNVETNQSTWEEPPEYTKYLLKYREFEKEYSKYTKNREGKPVNGEGKTSEEKMKRSSPSLVPYDGDDGAEDSSLNCSKETPEDEKETLQMEVDAVIHQGKVASKRSMEDDERDGEAALAKKIKLDNPDKCALFNIGLSEIEEQVVQMEETRKLLSKVSGLLGRCDRSMRIDGHSVEYVEATLLVRLEDWRAGYLPTPYFTSKIRECLCSIQNYLEPAEETKENVDNMDNRCIPDEENSKAKPDVLEETIQPPLPPTEITVPPPLPETTPPRSSASRSLISAHYGEGTDDEADGANSEASTELGSSRTSSPFPPLDPGESLPEAPDNLVKSEAKATKKMKPLMTASISMRKKKVSSLVEKWQKVQQELGK